MDFLFLNWKKFIVFVVGGTIGSLVNIGLTYFLTEFLGFWYLSSFILGSLINILFNFGYHCFFTFRIRNKIKSRMIKFFLVSIISIFFVVYFVYFLTDIIGLWYLFSVILTMVIVSIANFLINKFWVFFHYE